MDARTRAEPRHNWYLIPRGRRIIPPVACPVAGVTGQPRRRRPLARRDGRSGCLSYQATVPTSTPAGTGTEAGSAGSAVKRLPRKIPKRDCPSQTSDPMITLPSTLAQPR